MPLKIPQSVEHYLGRFEGAAGRQFELAVVRAPSSQLMGCDGFLDFGLAGRGIVGEESYKLLDARGDSDCVAAAIHPEASFAETVPSVVHDALMRAQSIGTPGMWINLSDELLEHFGMDSSDGQSISSVFEGMVQKVKDYWMNVDETQPEAHVGSVIIGAGANVYAELGRLQGIASMVNPFMQIGGFLKLV